MTAVVDAPKGLLSADAAIKALNARGLTTRPVEIGDGRELVHEETGRVFVDWVVPEYPRNARLSRRWYILVAPDGNRRNYGEDYSRAVRHFEFLTRPAPSLTLDLEAENAPSPRM